MGNTDRDELGRILSAGVRGGNGRPLRCGRCETQLDEVAESVEVELDGKDGHSPDALLCSRCYETVLDDVGIAPRRVFKTGPHRTVVLPLSQADLESGSD